jgi:hypothetical protein
MSFLKLGTSRHQLQAETASKMKAESKLETYRRYGSFRIMGRCSLEEGTPRLSVAYRERRPRTAAHATIWRPDQYMTCAIYRESLIALRGIWG